MHAIAIDRSREAAPRALLALGLGTAARTRAARGRARASKPSAPSQPSYGQPRQRRHSRWWPAARLLSSCGVHSLRALHRARRARPLRRLPRRGLLRPGLPEGGVAGAQGDVPACAQSGARRQAARVGARVCARVLAALLARLARRGRAAAAGGRAAGRGCAAGARR